MWGSIISTIGGLAGSILGNKSAEDQNEKNRQMNATKIRTTVKDARAAGIHPLAALGSPVAGSWATPVGQPGHGDAVADGAARIGAAIDKGGTNALTEASIATERAKARNLDADTASKLAAARATTLAASARLGGQSLDVAHLGRPDRPVPVTAFGKTLVRDPKKFSSAQTATDEFGEIADWVVGGPALLEASTRDFFHSMNVRNALRNVARKENRSRVPPMSEWSVP